MTNEELEKAALEYANSTFQPCVYSITKAITDFDARKEAFISGVKYILKKEVEYLSVNRNLDAEHVLLEENLF